MQTVINRIPNKISVIWLSALSFPRDIKTVSTIVSQNSNIKGSNMEHENSFSFSLLRKRSGMLSIGESGSLEIPANIRNISVAMEGKN